MCQFASFWHRPDNGDLAVFDLESHSNTQEKLKLNENLWREGHYLVNGTIECRVEDRDRQTQEECNNRLLNRFSTFSQFFNWAIRKSKQQKKYSGSLYLRGCDLKGITLPESIGGYI